MTSVFQSNLTPACLKVLLVEDCAEDTEIIQELLLESSREKSMDLTHVVCLSEARKILTNEIFNVILLDISIADRQQFNTFFRLQKYGINIPIIIITTREEEELAVELIAAGAQDYLIKRQVDSQLLMRTLRCAIVRHKRQAEWQKSQEKYPAVVNNIKEVVFEADPAGNWTFLNPAWTEITGFTIDESLGTPCLNYIYPDDRQHYLNKFRCLMEGEEASCCYQIRYLVKDGGFCWIEVQAGLIFGWNGAVEGTTGTLNDITETILAKQELEASKKFLNYTIDTVAYPIFVKDEQHRWILLNEAFCKLIGKQREELLGKSDYDFLPKEEADVFWQNDEQVFRTGEENDSEEIFTDANGKTHILSTKKTAFKNTDGSTILVGIIRDITEDRRKQLALQQSEARLRQLAANLPGVIYQFRLSPDGQKSWPYISSGCRELYELEAEEFHDNPEVFFNLIHPDDIQKFEESIAVSGTTLQPWQQEWRVILPSGKLKWLQGFSRPERVNFQSEIGQEGDIIWEGMVLDISDRKQAELALRESEERLRSLVENIPGAIYRCRYDADWTIEFVSDEIEAISGYPAGDFIQNRRLSFPSIINPADREIVDRKVGEAVASRQPFHIEYRIVRADRTTRWISERGRPIYSVEGQVLWLEGAIFDITDRKQAELTLRLVTQAVESASDAIAIADLDGYSIFHNQAFIQRYGYTVEELNNAGGPAVMYTKYQELRKLFIALRKGLPWSGEVQLKAKNGKSLGTQLQADCIKNSSGQPIGMMAVIADLTELKRTELALRLSQERLQLAVSGSSLGLWDWNIATGETFFDSQWKAMLGYAETEIENNIQSWESLLHPEDKPKVMELLKTYWEGRTDLYEVEFRMLNQAGNWQWIMALGKVVEYDEWGEALRMTGIHQNINARVAAETALRASEQRFRAVFEQAAIGIVQVWPDGQFLKVNQRFCNIIGYSESELKLRNFWEISHPEDVEEDLVSGRRMLAGEILNYSVEKRFIRKDGSFVWSNVTVSLVRDGCGEASYAIGVIEDISDRKFAEASLRQQLKRERLVVGILERIRSSLNLEEILTKAVAEVRLFLQTDRTIIYRFNPDWSGVVVVESVGENWMPLQRIVIKDSCLGESYVSDYKYGRTRVMNDIHNANISECHVNLLAQFQVKANLVVPMLQGEKLWGLLIAHECAAPRRWQEIEVQCLKQISVQLAIAIKQSTLFEQAQTEIADRKQAESNLQESEARERSKALQLEIAINQLRNTQTQLVQNEKMVSLGQLVAGVAHEINNPVNFIHGNLNPARGYALDLLDTIKMYQQHYPHPPAEVLNKIAEIDLDYVAEDLPKMFKSMQIGTERIVEIVKSLRNFSRLDEADRKSVNIHEGIDSTLMILQNRLKSHNSRPAIQVVKDYQKLPKVECFPGSLNQVFMNILINAIDALEEWDKQREREECDRHPSTIAIRTYLAAEGIVAISISDTGPGIPKSVISRLFDPFFTTKPVGKGTGLGLSISHSIVVDRHGGKLSCISTPGQGSEFLIEIPVHPNL